MFVLFLLYLLLFHFDFLIRVFEDHRCFLELAPLLNFSLHSFNHVKDLLALLLVAKNLVDFEVVVYVSHRILLDARQVQKLVHASVSLGHKFLVALAIEDLYLELDQTCHQANGDLDVPIIQIVIETLKELIPRLV